jgi:AraC-like DNA-binding protein
LAEINIYSAKVLRPIADALTRAGIPVETCLRRARLPCSSLDETDLYVSTEAFWQFGGGTALREGIPDLGVLAGSARAMGPTFRHTLRDQPSLYRGLRLLIRTLANSASGCSLQLEVDDPDTVRMYNNNTFGPEHPCHYQMEWFALAGIIDIVRIYAGRDWQPVSIGRKSAQAVDPITEAHFPRSLHLHNQARSYITIERRLLGALPLAPMDSTPGSDAIDSHPHVAHGYANCLKQLMSAYLAEGTPNIHLMSEIGRTSARTMQRRLAEMGLTYREVLEQARYDRATFLLAQGDMAVADIATQLGYGEPTHFSRAFRRMAGLSPLEYRHHSVIH